MEAEATNFEFFTQEAMSKKKKKRIKRISTWFQIGTGDVDFTQKYIGYLFIVEG